MMFNTLSQALTLSQNDNLDRVNLYDFDGVLASPFEEALFTMEDSVYDSEFIQKTCNRYDLDLRLESKQSQRYICLQAVMLRNGIDVQPGPITPESGVPYHIITARCDRFAVARMHNFVDDRGLTPIKTMHTDHLSKGFLIEVLLERHQNVHFSFWDDNPRHIQSAYNLRCSRLSVFKVDNDMAIHYINAKTYYLNTILELAL